MAAAGHGRPGGGLTATAGQSFSADTAWSIVLAPAPN